VFALVILVVLVPMFFGGQRRNPRRMANSTQLRGIHQGLVTFANSNKGHFPGLDSSGAVINGTVEYRFQILLEQNFFTPEYAVSPSETGNVTEWVEPLNSNADVAVTVMAGNYSYAMLQMKQPGGRQAEWSQSLNTQAIVMSDRDTANNAHRPTSIHTRGTDPWKGSVLWNDNHVAFEQSHIFTTGYMNPNPGGQPYAFTNDNIFSATGPDDAWLIYSGD